MTETFTLAQLSDPHLTAVSGFAPRYWNSKRFLGYVNWRRTRRTVHRIEIADRLAADARMLRVDHIAVTGDLVNLGLPAEHDAALAWLHSVGPPEHVTVIPGNHDIYSMMRGDRGIARWASYMGGEEETLAFPFVRRAGPLALVGMNSAEETPPFVAAGKLGPDQLQVAGDLLVRLGEEGVIRVVLIHHPPLSGLAPPRRALTDTAHFVRMIERSGAELVLYGHNHVPALHWIDAPNGPIPVVGAASASASRPIGDEPLAQYNVFTFFRHGNRLRIRQTIRGLEMPDGPVVRLSERVLDRGG